MLPFTSIFPPSDAFDPTIRMDPDVEGEFAEAIVPVTELLFANEIVPLLMILPLIVAVPVDLTNFRLPTMPPEILEELPI